MSQNTLNLVQVNITCPPSDKRICIAHADELTLVYIKDIIRCESVRNYTNIFLQDKSRLLASKSLSEFEERLAPYGFFRVHHHSLVNMAFVKGFRKKDGGTAVLLDDSEIPIATRKRNEFTKLLKSM